MRTISLHAVSLRQGYAIHTAKQPKRRDRRRPNPGPHHTLRCADMLYEITVEAGYLKVDLFNRQTAEETRDAFAAIAAEARKHACSQILISVHASRPIFKVEQYGLPDYFKELGRIALTGDSAELRISQQYIESLARQYGINVRSFPNEQAALHWFKDRRWSPDRRQRQEPWEGQERRQQLHRRSLESIGLDSAGRIPV